MPTILGVFNISLVHPTKFLRGYFVNNAPSFYNFGPFSSSQNCRLQVKVNNVQDSSRFNNFEKIIDYGPEKKRFTIDDYVVSQNFIVRLYELDIHQKASLEALLNYTQETGLNLFQSSGILVEGFGVSKEMTSRNLIWVIGKMQVQIYSYPSWGDVVRVETWCSGLSKHCLKCSSGLIDAYTGNKLMRVDSDYVMINEKTRRLSKLPEEIKAKGDPYVKEYLGQLLPAVDKGGKLRKLPKLDQDKADNTLKGIKPLWFDLDPNQHVNNVKYTSWILEGTPDAVRENYELAAITIEYRRECGRESVLQSLSKASNEVAHEYHHLLQLDNGNEVARATTLWRKSHQL